MTVDVKEILKTREEAVYIDRIDTLTCSCGNVQSSYYIPYNCENCGNTNIKKINSLNKKGKVTVTPILNVISKDEKSFHIEKIEVIMEIDKENFSSKLKEGRKMELIWSLKDRELKMLRNGKLVENAERYDTFFRGLSHRYVLNEVITPGNKELLEFAFNNLGKYYDERSHKLHRALDRLLTYPIIELFHFSGFGHLLSDIWSYHLWKYSKETKPHKILGVPKYMMKYLKKLTSLSSWTVDDWVKLDSKIGGNNAKVILEVLDDESDIKRLTSLIGYYLDLHENYNYRNHKKLITYLARDIKIMQGISDPVDGARTLRDYVRMCKEMGINPEKYSKNLRKDHDIAVMNYRMMQDEIRHEQFKKEMEKPVWDEILYENDTYAVVKPESPQDLIDEGESLGHCVASYVDDVIKGRCKIFFLRFSNMKETGLVTIEVRGTERKNLRIVQVKGSGNRNPSREEKDFIVEWAEKRNLQISY